MKDNEDNVAYCLWGHDIYTILPTIKWSMISFESRFLVWYIQWNEDELEGENYGIEGTDTDRSNEVNQMFIPNVTWIFYLRLYKKARREGERLRKALDSFNYELNTTYFYVSNIFMCIGLFVFFFFILFR